MTDWAHETDVIVLGTGAAGMTATLAAAASGAEVAVYEKSAKIGGTTAVSGGIAWIPAHDRSAQGDLTVADAMAYLRAQSFGAMDEALVETFVRTGQPMIDFVEAHSDLRFEIATGFPDYKPELPGGRPGGGRSLGPATYDMSRVPGWREQITAFPPDFSNVGLDAETRARLHADYRPDAGDNVIAGMAMIAGLLKGLLDLGVEPQVNARAIELIASAGVITGVRIKAGNNTFDVRARRGVVLANGGFEWNQRLVEAFLRGPMHGPVSPPNNTGDALQMAMAHGADLANMGEAWWVPVIQIPGDVLDGQPRSRSVRLERTRPRSIIVNRAGARFINEACDYNSMAGAFQYLHPRDGYVNDPAWIVFDDLHLKRYGFLGVEPGGQALDWFCPSRDLAELADKTGIDAEGLARTVAGWNDCVSGGPGRPDGPGRPEPHDPDFGRGASAYDGYWGDPAGATPAEQTLGPLDTPPYYAVPAALGAMGTKGGPRTDRDGRVLHVSGSVIPGLYAAGNAMAGVTGRAYGGAGGTIGPAMVFGYRAGVHAATGRSARVNEKA